MEYWEFLLQKEGNRRWIPIKNAKVQLEEGKYRVVAHSSYTNCHVEVRVSYQSTDEVPPKRRSQKRSRHTNEEGLMVVIPFTSLKTGLWELRCSGDVASDFFGESWQESVKFQVLPQKIEEEVKAASDEISSIEADLTTTIQQERVEKELSTSKRNLGEEELTSESSLEGEENSVTAEFELETNPDETSPQENFDTELTTLENKLEAEELSEANSLDKTDQEKEKNSVGEEFEFETYLTAPSQPEDVENELTTSENNVEAELDPESYFNQPDLEESNVNVSSVEEEFATYFTDSLQQERVEEEELSPTSYFDQSEQGNSITEFQDRETTPHPQVSLEEITALETESEETNQENLTTEHASTEEIEDPFEIYLQEDKNLVTEEFESITTSQTEVTEIQEEIIYNLTPEEIAASERKELAAYDGEWENSSQTDITSTPTNQILNQSVENLEKMLEEIIDPLLHDIENTPEKLDFYSQTSEQEIDHSEIPSEEEEKLTLTLDREAFVRRQGESVVVSGRLDISPREQYFHEENLFNGTLRYRLRNPQTSETLFEAQQPLKEQRIPLAFSYPLDIPLECDSHLILGEVILEQQREWQNPHESYKVVSIQSFSIAADLSELLTAVSLVQVEEEIETGDVSSDSSQSSLLSSPETSGINLDFLNFVDGPSNRDNQKNSPQPSNIETPEIHVESSLVEDNVSPVKRIEEISGDEEEDTNINTETEVEEEPSSGAFKSLNSQERFFSRLNSLAIDHQVSELPSETKDTAIENLDSSTTSEITDVGENSLKIISPNLKNPQPKPSWEINAKSRYSPTNVAADLNSYEIVVDDDEGMLEAAPKLDSSGLPYPAELIQTPKEASLSSEAPVPTPVLTILDEELTANQPAILRIKLPPYTGPIYVKLWIQDRQTRYITESPRALTDFATTRTGDLETLAQVVVPEGSMEVRLHAIAIDTESQCESRKATLDRVVIPPDLPEVSLGDF